jgi:hypothetical protein
MRAPKRKISDAIYRQLVADDAEMRGSGRAGGDDSNGQRERPNPDGRLFGSATARTPPQAYAPTRRLTEGCHFRAGTFSRSASHPSPRLRSRLGDRSTLAHARDPLFTLFRAPHGGPRPPTVHVGTWPASRAA